MKVNVKYPHSVDYKKKLYLPGEPLPKDMPKKEIERLVKKGRVEVSEQEDVIAKKQDSKDMTVVALKKLLDKLEVEYDTKAKKDDLIALIKAKISELKDMTVPLLKKLLDKLEVEYDAKAIKDDLIALVEVKITELCKG